MLFQNQYQILVLAALHRTAIVVQGAKDHLHRHPLQRFAQRQCDLLADRQQDGVKNQRCVDLQLDRIGRARPHVRQIQDPFGQRDGVLDPPAPPRPLTDVAGRQHLRIEDIRQTDLPPSL